MVRHTGNKAAPAQKRGGIGTLLSGILIGMALGMAIAAGLAWFLMKSPSPFVQNEQAGARPPAEAKLQPAPAAKSEEKPAASDKQRFSFYKELTDKPESASTAKPAAKPQAPESKPAASGPQYLQAGAFSSAEDAEKLKARLALMGFQASIQTVTLPDKGVWHRVRIGPYKSADEMEKARVLMKQNGVDATPTRAQ